MRAVKAGLGIDTRWPSATSEHSGWRGPPTRAPISKVQPSPKHALHTQATSLCSTPLASTPLAQPPHPWPTTVPASIPPRHTPKGTIRIGSGKPGVTLRLHRSRPPPPRAPTQIHWIPSARGSLIKIA